MTDHDRNEEAPDENPHQSVPGGIEAAAVEPTADRLGLTLPDDPHEAQMILMRELLETRVEAGELLANLHRLAAEFDNYRKRTERDQIDNIQRAGQRIIEALLPSLDGLDGALAIEAATESESRMLNGMRGTQSLILDALARDGFEPIVAVGAPFDPALHEAVSVIPGDGEQIVQQELRKGYVMRGRLIRPSLVIVGHA